MKPLYPPQDFETVGALKTLLSSGGVSVPYTIFRDRLYAPSELYDHYRVGHPETQSDCLDSLVYQHYLTKGKHATEVKEALARSLHDYSISKELSAFLANYDERQVVGVMGGHGLLRTDAMYRQVVYISKKLAEEGCLMVSGGGPGAMEATHLGAWMAGRSDSEVEEALLMLAVAPSFRDPLWLDSAFRIIEAYPQSSYRSLGVPTWLYGHEPATPFATHIAKYFDNSIREDGILTIAFGGIIYSPGSAGTVQEIFQDAVQNHYLTFGYASPMVFLGRKFWTEEMPIYPMLQQLMTSGRYNNLLLSISDDVDDVVDEILRFKNDN